MADEEKLERLRDWMKENGIELRGCVVKKSPETGGCGVFSGDSKAQDILMVSPLALSLTHLKALEDPLLGAQYKEMRDVDDRLLVMIFLMVERARGKASFWFPYLDMLPSEFGTPLSFTEEELQELAGTALFEATKAQLRLLRKLFGNVKEFSESALSTAGVMKEITFSDFLWANCIFWTRALIIPWPKTLLSSVFSGGRHTERVEEPIYIEGLVPGIDFCNHDRKAGALWEVDDMNGSNSGAPHSMYLVAGEGVAYAPNTEIRINYGDKGNEELLFLYGFVEDNNPHDYVMVHISIESLSKDPCVEYKLQLLQEQDMSLRWLLPAVDLEGGFQAPGTRKHCHNKQAMGYSWSGLRKLPGYTELLVFREDMLSSLRILAMSAAALESVAGLLEELTHPPSKDDILAAVWEVCGDTQALSLLVRILSARVEELVSGSGTEEHDEEILSEGCFRSPNHRASVIYRKGQKQLMRRFLKEAELALAACLSEEEGSSSSQ